MLPRILEPEVMDTPEEARDYDAMDHREVNARFVSDFLSAGAQAGWVLDLGSGTGLIPIELIRTRPDFRVVALEFARSMLEVARGHLSRLGLTQAIFLLQADAKQLPFPDRAFSLVMSNSLIHHLPEPLCALKEAHRVTAPGGLLFFRDLVRPATEGQLESLVNAYAADANGHQRKMFADSLRASLTVAEVRELVQQLGYSPGTVMMTSDRHWTWCARKAP